MDTKTSLINQLNSSVEELLKAAKRVPADKLTWAVNDAGRTVMSQMQECAVLSGWSAKVIADKKMGPMGDEQWAEYQAACDALDTLDKCEAALLAGTAQTVEAINGVNDADWDVVVELPWGPKTVHELATYALWNNTYHLGQINFIQTLYGDKDM